MKRFLLLLVALAFSILASAAPPYDVTVTFSAPATGGAPDGYSFYIDDCAVSGPIDAPTASAVAGQTFPAIIIADGTYLMCIRAFNAAGTQPDPGQVATADINDLPIPGPIQNLGIQVTCPASNCVVEVVVN